MRLGMQLVLGRKHEGVVQLDAMPHVDPCRTLGVVKPCKLVATVYDKRMCALLPSALPGQAHALMQHCVVISSCYDGPPAQVIEQGAEPGCTSNAAKMHQQHQLHWAKEGSNLKSMPRQLFKISKPNQTK